MGTPIEALLALEDGSLFAGDAIGALGVATGEVVFNTAMTGYQEILTDPSYCRQIVALTCPHIGNVGTNDEDEESRRAFASGLVVRDVPRQASNWRSRTSLTACLQRHGVIGLAGIDTRRLTRLLREKGALAGTIVAGTDIDTTAAVAAARDFPGLGGMDLARVVSIDKPYEWTDGPWTGTHGFRLPEPGTLPWRVVAYDFGIKRNILRSLVSRGCRVEVVPARTPAREVLSRSPHGVFLSNGPGDPEPCGYAIDAIRQLLEREIPIFGICLGHQLLALASGARTMKMKFGHHGANHPVAHLDTGRILITSQNHGFAVDESSLPENLVVTHRSLFDGTIQGLCRNDVPAVSFQGHPEASPGPHDPGHLFDQFIEMMAARARSRPAFATQPVGETPDTTPQPQR